MTPEQMEEAAIEAHAEIIDAHTGFRPEVSRSISVAAIQAYNAAMPKRYTLAEALKKALSSSPLDPPDKRSAIRIGPFYVITPGGNVPLSAAIAGLGDAIDDWAASLPKPPVKS